MTPDPSSLRFGRLRATLTRLCLAAGLLGCTGDVQGPAAPGDGMLGQAGSAAQDDAVDKVLNGTVSAWRSVVKLSVGNYGCTGTLIGPQVLLTSAHCFEKAAMTIDIDGDGERNAGWVATSVTYRNYVDNQDYCLTRSSGAALGACGSSSNDKPTLSVVAHPSYFTYPYTEWDLALVVSGRPWNAPANTSTHWASLLDNNAIYGKTFRALGYGAFAEGGTAPAKEPNGTWRWTGISDGKLRYTYPLRIDSVSPWGYLQNRTQAGKQLCRGDSGGPAMPHIGTLLVYGVYSNSSVTGKGTQLEPFSACAVAPWQNWAPVANKAWWFNDTLSRMNLPQCRWIGAVPEDRTLYYRNCY